MRIDQDAIEAACARMRVRSPEPHRLLAVGWAAYVFVLTALISFLEAFLSGGGITGIPWLSQAFFQLVLLAHHSHGPEDHFGLGTCGTKPTPRR